MAAGRNSILSNILLILLAIIFGIILILALYTIFDAQAGASEESKDYLTYKGNIYKNVTDAKRIQVYGANPKASIRDYLGKAEEKSLYTTNILDNQSVLVVETRSGYEYYEFVKAKGDEKSNGKNLCSQYGIKDVFSIDRILVSKRDGNHEMELSKIEKENFSKKIMGYQGIANYIDCRKKIPGTKIWNIRDRTSLKTFINLLKHTTALATKSYKKYEKQADKLCYDFVVLIRGGVYLKGTYTPSIAGISCGGHYILSSKQNKAMKTVFK